MIRQGFTDDAGKLVDPDPWVPMTDIPGLKMLGKLSEELGEATAAVSRCIIQGIDKCEPVTKVLNKVWLENELADVFATMTLVSDYFELDRDRMVQRSHKKMGHLREWHKQNI